jgi:hypothetical protein
MRKTVGSVPLNQFFKPSEAVWKTERRNIAFRPKLLPLKAKRGRNVGSDERV